jgi:hypothetical protein
VKEIDDWKNDADKYIKSARLAKDEFSRDYVLLFDRLVNNEPFGIETDREFYERVWEKIPWPFEIENSEFKSVVKTFVRGLEILDKDGRMYELLFGKNKQ